MTTLTAVRCLAAIARHHGLSVQPEYILHEFALGEDEPKLAEFVRMAKAIQLRGKATRITWGELAGLKGVFPFVVQRKDGSYCLVAGMAEEGGESCVVIIDTMAPSAGATLVSRADFEKVWSGDVLFLKRQYLLSEEGQPFGLRWFFPILIKHKKAFRDIAIATLTLNFVMLGVPLFTQLVIDKVLVHENRSTLWVLTIGVLILIGFEAVITFVRQYLLLAATNKIDIRLSRKVFSHLLGLPIDYFDRQPAGLITRHVQQIQQIRSFLTGSLFFTLLESVSFFIFLPVLFGYSFKLTIVVLAISLAMAGVIAALLGPFSRRLEKLSGAESSKQAMLVENIHGARTIKSLAIEPKQKKTWDQRCADAVTLHFSVMNISLAGTTISQVLQRVMTVAIIVFGCLEVFDRNLTVGGLIAFQMLSGRVIGPLVQIVGLIHEYQQTAISVRMLADVMNHPAERKSASGLRNPLKGGITFEDVTFRYPGADVAALDHVHLEIEPGQVIGVVGKSGSGKSTFAKLLQGLYSAQEGIIRFDGSDIREIDLSHLRHNIGVVLQENFLFKGSIRENIGIARPGASFEEIVNAARAAGAEEFIERLAHGYDTVLEEGATNLSGGQRQRLAIARAILTRPKLLLLDEAASALDPESEAIFMDNLAQIAKGKTVIIISHRLSTLVGCDKIVFFERGRILDAAPHAELLQRCQPYAHLWQQQNRHL